MAEILLVEDNEGDRLLAEEVLSHGPVPNHLHIAKDGVEALDFLHRDGNFSSVPRPDMILLDLNLPRVTGHEVLDAVKNDERLRSIPVIILTCSSDEEDIRRSYRSHANSYITKPVNLDDYGDVMDSIERYWLDLVRLPVH